MTGSPWVAVQQTRIAGQRRARDAAYRRGLLRADVYVCEFPKSGGSWVTALATDLLRESGRTRPAVMHVHWRQRPLYRPAVYVLRDGRDVVVSLYFHHVRHLLGRTIWTRRVHRFFSNVLGAGYDPNDARCNLPRFIESLYRRPFGGLLRPGQDSSFLPWPDHVGDWLHAPGVLVVRYEALHEAPARELGRIQEQIGTSLEAPGLEAVIERNSFARKAGRQPGAEDRTSFLRKGVVGDWRTWFTADAGRAFLDFGGPALQELGYEPDSTWADRLPATHSSPGSSCLS